MKCEAGLRFWAKVDEYYKEEDGGVNESWKSMKSAVLSAAEEVCGTTKGGKHQEKET